MRNLKFGTFKLKISLQIAVFEQAATFGLSSNGAENYNCVFQNAIQNSFGGRAGLLGLRY
jgi:hypothetical protein